MDLNRFTQKSQEALGVAQNLAIRYGHVEVDTDHLLLALLEQEEGLIPRMLLKMDAPAEEIRDRVEAELSRRPRVSGPGAEPGKIYVTNAMNQTLVEAEAEAKRLKDEYVSVEHVFLALFTKASTAPGMKIVQSYGITRDKFLRALTDIRGNQRVTRRSRAIEPHRVTEGCRAIEPQRVAGERRAIERPCATG